MKKSSIILTIVCISTLLAGITCYIIGGVIAGREGIAYLCDHAQDGDFSLSPEDWGFVINSYDDGEKVDVESPFFDVHVDGDDVSVNPNNQSDDKDTTVDTGINETENN